LAEHNSLVENDFDELARSMREQGKEIMAKRGAELAIKFFELNKRLKEDAGPSMDRAADLGVPFAGANMDPPPDPGVAADLGHETTFCGAESPGGSGKGAHGPTPSIAPEDTSKAASASPTITATKGGKSAIYIDDVPSFDLFQPDEPEYEYVCGHRSRSTTPAGLSLFCPSFFSPSSLHHYDMVQ
jgi:hypothetical protein